MRTHCKYNHALVPGNLYIKPSRPTERICLTCKRIDIWMSPARALAGLPPIPRQVAEIEVLAYGPWVAMSRAARSRPTEAFVITPANVDSVRIAGGYVNAQGEASLAPKWVREATQRFARAARIAPSP